MAHGLFKCRNARDDYGFRLIAYQTYVVSAVISYADADSHYVVAQNF